MDTRKHVDFVSAIVLMALSVYVIFEGYSYYQAIQVRGVSPFYESPGFFPVIVGSGLLICSVMLLVRSLKGGALAENVAMAASGFKNFVTSDVAWRALLGCAWMGFYVFFLLSWLGFILASFLFLIVLMTFLHLDKIIGVDVKSVALTFVKIVVVTGVTVGMLFGVFNGIFGVPLP